MVPSFQHVYTVSVLIGKVEYVARQNVYDKPEKKQLSIFNSEVEEKWKRLRPTANRQYYHSSSQIEIELEESEDDATYEQSKSAFYYMFNRVYRQWQEATETEKQEYEAIINFKNSTKIPRFICNFARFRKIMEILWHDDVYPFIEISEIIKAPYLVSEYFIEAVKNVVDQMFPPNLRRDNGTKVLVIEKDTAIMGDLFFGHVDYVSRQLFDISSIQEKFNSSPMTSRSLKKNYTKQEVTEYENLIHADALAIIQSKFIFFSSSTFAYYRQFHNNKDRLTRAIEYLINTKLIHQDSSKNRFIKGTRNSYAMATPNQIKNNTLSMQTLAKWNLNIDDYEKLWQQCILPTPEMASKIEKSTIEHINTNLYDYIPIIHRLGDANDPVAQQILKPGLHSGQIGIHFNSNTFSLSTEHILHSNNVNDIMNELSKLCIRATDKKTDLLKHGRSSMTKNHHSIGTANTSLMNSSQPDVMEISLPTDDDIEQLQTKLFSSSISINISSKKNDQTHVNKEQVLSNKEGSCADNNNMEDCIYVFEKTKNKNNVIQASIIQDDATIIRQWSDIDKEHDTSSINVNNLIQTMSSNISSCEISITDKTNGNKTVESCRSIEYDYPTNDFMNINNIDKSLYNQQESHEELFPELSSSITIDYNNDKRHKNIEYGSVEMDSGLNYQTSSPGESTSPAYTRTSEDLNNTFNEENRQSIKAFNVIALSKKLMLKPFIAFTKTDATRIYNNAEIKNTVIGYLQEHGFIKQIDDLFLSTVPTKKMIKYEIGYLKLFPASQSAYETTLFEIKLREKVDITFDEYVDKVFNDEKSSVSSAVGNNMFNTAHHNWLLNRVWYDKLKEGEISTYFRNKIICPEEKISLPMVTTISAVSHDNVRDSFDQPRSKLTSSQRTSKELRRLGAKRPAQPSDEPSSKRQRKPKRFPDEG